MFVLVAFVVFGVLALAAYWPVYPGDGSRLPTCACADPVQSVWFLRWVPWALAHGQDPFLTHAINVPVGANLAQNTLMPLLGILAAPMTVTLGPVASFNLLAWLAFPISATSMLLVAHRLTGSRAAATAAGLLYGFSPYMVGQGQAHIMLSFVPIPPLLVLTSWKILVERRRSPFVWGALLAAEVIAQFLIEPEVLATMGLILGLGATGLAVLHRRSITTLDVAHVTKALLTCAAVATVALGFPVWFMLFGPHHFTGPNFPATNPYRSDLLGPVLPTLNERIVPGGLQHFAAATAGGDYAETGGYVGIVLLAALTFAVVRHRSQPALRLTVALAIAAWALSLGPKLVVDTEPTSVPLPFSLLVRLPLLGDILPGRFALAQWLFLSLTAAFSISAWQRSGQLHQTSRQAAGRHQRRALRVLLIVGILISLLPRWPYRSQAVHVPAVLSASSTAVPDGATLLTYPLPLYPQDQGMLWQASSGFRFRLLGAYIQNPSVGGNQTEFPTLLSPPAVEEWLADEEHVTDTGWAQIPAAGHDDLRRFLLEQDVGAVVVDRSMVNAGPVAQAFEAVLGPPSSTSESLSWLTVQADLRRGGW